MFSKHLLVVRSQIPSIEIGRSSRLLSVRIMPVLLLETAMSMLL